MAKKQNGTYPAAQKGSEAPKLNKLNIKQYPVQEPQSVSGWTASGWDWLAPAQSGGGYPLRTS